MQIKNVHEKDVGSKLMRLTFRLLLGVGALCFFPSAASAQTDSDDIDAILGLEPAPQAPGPTAPANAVPTLGNTNAPETYVVRYGDTLWDLCARFLNNPWYWPKGAITADLIIRIGYDPGLF